jgi:MscS family membrane protein
LKRALQILEEIYRSHPMTLDVWISFNKFADSALNIQVIHWWKSTDQKVYLAGMQQLNLRIKERFDQEGIDFAFPTQTLHVKQRGRGFLPVEAEQPPLLEKKQT